MLTLIHLSLYYHSDLLTILIDCAGLSADRANNLTQRTRAAKRYLKADYKLHVIEESPCADHCIKFALSSNEDQFKSDCKHDHDMICDRCQDCRDVCQDILSEIASKNISFR